METIMTAVLLVALGAILALQLTDTPEADLQRRYHRLCKRYNDQARELEGLRDALAAQAWHDGQRLDWVERARAVGVGPRDDEKEWGVIDLNAGTMRGRGATLREAIDNARRK